MMAGGRLMRMEKQSMPDRGMEGRRRGIESERCVFLFERGRDRGKREGNLG